MLLINFQADEAAGKINYVSCMLLLVSQLTGQPNLGFLFIGLTSSREREGGVGWDGLPNPLGVGLAECGEWRGWEGGGALPPPGLKNFPCAQPN